MGEKKAGCVLKNILAQEFQCCFCGESTDLQSLVTLNIDLGDEQYQFLAAHGLCLKNKLHSSVPFLAPEELDEE